MNSSRKKPISVALAIDNSIYLAGISKLIRSFDGFTLAIAADSISDLLARLPDVLPPDISLIDLNIHEEGSREHIKQIKEHWPASRILIISNYDHPYNIIKAFQVGGNGHLCRDCDKEELYRALLSIHYTGQYFNETVLKPKSLGGKSVSEQAAPITGQELHLLTLFCSELSNEEIAEQLGLTMPIVEGYQGILFDKLNVSSRVGLAVCAYKMGIITDTSGLLTGRG